MNYSLHGITVLSSETVVTQSYFVVLLNYSFWKVRLLTTFMIVAIHYTLKWNLSPHESCNSTESEICTYLKGCRESAIKLCKKMFLTKSLIENEYKYK